VKRKKKLKKKIRSARKARRAPKRIMKPAAKRGRARIPEGSRQLARSRPLRRTRKSRRTAAISPRQVAVRAQETAFQLIASMDRGEVVSKFLRRYASERGRAGRIADPGRFRELVGTIRREAFLVLSLKIEAEAAQRLGGRAHGKSSPAEFDLVKLFREEFYIALGRGLDYSDEEFGEFCRDLEVYRTLRESAGNPQPRARALSSPKGPFVDRCGFLLDSPMLDQARHAAWQFEVELMATATAALRKVFARRGRL
jgi:hypothetical protein